MILSSSRAKPPGGPEAAGAGGRGTHAEAAAAGGWPGLGFETRNTQGRSRARPPGEGQARQLPPFGVSRDRAVALLFAAVLPSTDRDQAFRLRKVATAEGSKDPTQGTSIC